MSLIALAAVSLTWLALVPGCGAGTTSSPRDPRRVQEEALAREKANDAAEAAERARVNAERAGEHAKLIIGSWEGEWEHRGFSLSKVSWLSFKGDGTGSVSNDAFPLSSHERAWKLEGGKLHIGRQNPPEWDTYQYELTEGVLKYWVDKKNKFVLKRMK